VKVALAQLNPTVGDIESNLAALRRTVDGIKPGSADLVVFPELFLCGYPPRDLLGLPWFIDRMEKALEDVLAVAGSRPDLGILLGTVTRSGMISGKGLFNSALLIEGGKVLFEQHKQLLPTYDVFDESRYFDAGLTSRVFSFRGEKLGISICEDAWNDPEFEVNLFYNRNPIEVLARSGSSLMINISASPYHVKKDTVRYERYSHHARKWRIPTIYIGQVGGNDDLIFDGRSMAFDVEGHHTALLKPFEEDLSIVDSRKTGADEPYQSLPDMEAMRRALSLGVSDYLRKCGFRNAVIGLSGGIDSALTACIAVDAIGSDNVRAITMPSGYSSKGSVDDSLKLADNLGIKCDVIPIDDILSQYEASLKQAFTNKTRDVTEENLQARIRGNLLMAYSNKFGGIVLATGNKSELAVGYCTLYGDMSGGLAVISDLPKMMVYELARWYNRDREIIPGSVFTKPPSAELSTDQKDQDVLPPYDILDNILEMYLDQRMSEDEIVSQGFGRETVDWVVKSIDRSEYKRRQAPLGLRVTTKAFGTGWRMPIAARKT